MFQIGKQLPKARTIKAENKPQKESTIGRTETHFVVLK